MTKEEDLKRVEAERDAALARAEKAEAEKARWVRVADDLEVQEKLKSENARLAARVAELERDQRLEAERDAALERAEKAEAAQASLMQQNNHLRGLLDKAGKTLNVEQWYSDIEWYNDIVRASRPARAVSDLEAERDALQRQLDSLRERLDAVLHDRARQDGQLQAAREELEPLRHLEEVVCEEADGFYASDGSGRYYTSDCPADAVRELGRLARAHKSEKDNWVGALRNVEAQLREAERELAETRARLDRALALGDALRTRLDAALVLLREVDLDVPTIPAMIPPDWGKRRAALLGEKL